MRSFTDEMAKLEAGLSKRRIEGEVVDQTAHPRKLRKLFSLRLRRVKTLHDPAMCFTAGVSHFKRLNRLMVRVCRGVTSTRLPALYITRNLKQQGTRFLPGLNAGVSARVIR